MSKYEMTIKLAQIQKLVEERKYKKAAAVLGTIDIRQVKSQSDLQNFAEIYVKTEQFEAAQAIYLRLYKKNHSKRILNRLLFLAIRTNHMEDAESFYEEYLSLSHSTRDNLIMRYRIDKAKGAPISQLIETLEYLKEEEYVEEWAYELAKLYQKAGREEDCRLECEDIKLWFGQGEIVERAEALLDYLDGGGGLCYEDKDYTEEEQEEPNPDDTGSLPDFETMKQEMLRQKKQEKEEKKLEKQLEKQQEKAQEPEEEEFVDDYDDQEDLLDGEAELDSADIANKAKKGFMRLTGFWKRGEKDSEEPEEEAAEVVEDAAEVDEEDTSSVQPAMEEESDGAAQSVSDETLVDEIAAAESDNTEGYAVEPSERTDMISSSGEEATENAATENSTGNDLASEVAAIFEAEKREQLKEKAAALLQEASGKMSEAPNIASDVLGRMTQAMQNKAGKTYIPLDISEEEISFSTTEPTGEPTPADNRIPAGMEEIMAYGDDEVTMIELDQIMPEPDLPELKQVMPEDSPELGNMPDLEEKDLPTTKALHHSFDDMLTLIAGEREPKHFVLIGEGSDKILGITKRIVRVNHKKGFLSTNQIARIHALQLNELDLLRVCHQIKGSCLLIDGAADLLFPTITKLFAVMDAFHGDFMVVLADDGNTLDELFKVAPALARRFEYILDISKYNEEDWRA